MRLFVSLAFVLLNLFNQIAWASPEVSVCSETLSVKVRGKEEPHERKLFGLCKENSSKNKKWIVDPQFNDLIYNEKEKIFSGWKYNNLDTIDGKSISIDDFEQFGLVSSSVFSPDGKKKFEISGEVSEFYNGIAGIKIIGDVTYFGFDMKELFESKTKRFIAGIFYYADSLLAGFSYWLESVLLIDDVLYRSIDDNYAKNSKRGFIDTDGKFIIQPKFHSSQFDSNFDPVYAIVATTDDKMGLIDKNENFVLEPKYQSIKLRKIEKWSLSSFKKYAPHLNNNSVGSKIYVTTFRECSTFKCNYLHEFLDARTLKIQGSWNFEENKLPILSLLSDDLDHIDLQDKEQMGRLGISAWIAGSLLLLPFCMIYQRFKKNASWGKTIFAGFGWSLLLSAIAIALTVIAVLIIGLVMVLAAGAGAGRAMTTRD